MPIKPENRKRYPAKLRRWCNRCHLVYDREHHAQTAYATRRAAANTQELPL